MPHADGRVRSNAIQVLGYDHDVMPLQQPEGGSVVFKDCRPDCSKRTSTIARSDGESRTDSTSSSRSYRPLSPPISFKVAPVMAAVDVLLTYCRGTTRARDCNSTKRLCQRRPGGGGAM